MRILLIEPDKCLAQIYTRSITKNGHKVSWVTSAQSGITQADKKCPDIVILELQLIEHSGIEFLYEFRTYSEWQYVPVIINTQVPPYEFSANWQILKDELGVCAYLYKSSTSIDALLANINQYLPAAKSWRS